MFAPACYSYTELCAELAVRLGCDRIPPATLSGWMRALKYPKGGPGKRRRRSWEAEDLEALAAYGTALSLGYSGAEAYDIAHTQVEKWRNQHGIT
jgi:hypothetical protein